VIDVPKRLGSGVELLADPTRRRIVGLLALRALRPSTIAREIGLSRPATTRQLHLMLEAGLLRATKSYIDGRAILYSINPRNHGPITAWLAGAQVARAVTLTLEDPDGVIEG
jgi:DNA-binding transcriptional ArsR family regulator